MKDKNEAITCEKAEFRDYLFSAIYYYNNNKADGIFDRVAIIDAVNLTMIDARGNGHLKNVTNRRKK